MGPSRSTSLSQWISDELRSFHHDVSGAIRDSPRISTTAPTPNGVTVSDNLRSCFIRCTGATFKRFVYLNCDIRFHGSHGVGDDPPDSVLTEALE